jgi:uncharacterized protein involved in tolerance to divalent cations
MATVENVNIEINAALKAENERLKNLLKEIEDICTDYEIPGIEALKILQLIKLLSKHEAK